MEDYGKFLEMVNEIKKYCRNLQGGKLTKEEILSYLEICSFRGTVAGIVPVS